VAPVSRELYQVEGAPGPSPLGTGEVANGSQLTSTPAEVEGELRAQIDKAKRAGIPISHLDNHMRAMLVTPALFQSYWKMGQEYDLPIALPNQQVTQRGVPGQKPT